MVKPILYMDFDGPLNVYLARLEVEHVYDVPLRCAFTGWVTVTLSLDRRHPALLAELAEHFELHWGTAWEHSANDHLAHLVGLPQLPVVEWGPDKFRGRPGPEHEGIHWKTATLADHADGRPFLWMDDECDSGDNDWLIGQGVQGYAMQISPTTGITADHVAQAIAWARSVEQRAA